MPSIHDGGGYGSFDFSAGYYGGVLLDEAAAEISGVSDLTLAGDATVAAGSVYDGFGAYPPYLLTEDQLARIVAMAWFFISIEPRTIDPVGVGITGFYGTAFDVTGEGTKGLTRVLGFMRSWPRAVVTIDVGEPGYQRMTPCTRQDILALRSRFYAAYGDVAKPNYYGAIPA